MASVEETVVPAPTPASFMVRSIDKHTIMRVIIIMCDKDFSTKSWEAVQATARHSASGKIMQNTCPFVADEEGVHSLHMTRKVEETQSSADSDRLIN